MNIVGCTLTTTVASSISFSSTIIEDGNATMNSLQGITWSVDEDLYALVLTEISPTSDNHVSCNTNFRLFPSDIMLILTFN